MHRLRLATATFAVALISACGALATLGAGAASASDFVVPFTNWQVSGTLRLAKLGQTVAFPAGSTFNGSADLSTGSISGNVFVPPFTSTIRILGIPTQVSQRIVQATPVSGSVSLGSGGTVTIKSSTSDTIYLTSVGLGPFTIPTTCRTSSPVLFSLNYTGPLTLSTGFHFTGTTTIPHLTGCGLLGPVLSLLLSGPGNAYSLSIAPPA